MAKDYKKILLANLQNAGIEKPESEVRFMFSRNWRFDYAFITEKVAIEYMGGLFMKKGGHTNVTGQTRDWEKLNEAQIRGWLVICVNPKTIDSGSAIDQIIRALKVQRKEMTYDVQDV